MQQCKGSKRDLWRTLATAQNVMLNSESVMLNLFQHLFRAGLFQHPVKSRSCDPENVDPDPETSSG
jgi:hypothetical protein